MSFFGEEATLFSKEYDVVEAMRAAWSADLQRFFDALHPEVGKLVEGTLRTRPTAGYRYWWIPSDFPAVGNATLWYSREYPELIRDQMLCWDAYLDIRGQQAPEATQVAWRSRVASELQKVPGLEVHMGAAGSFRPLSLRFRWDKAPVAESAVLVASILQVMNRAVSELGRAG